MTTYAVANILPSIVPLGDDALIVTFAHVLSWDVGVRIRDCTRRIRELQFNSVTDVVPAYTTLAVYFDSSRVSFTRLSASIADVVNGAYGDPHDDETGAVIEIPVHYDGPDLGDVAMRTGLTTDEVIARHSARIYRAYMTGFVPGFTYLGDLDPSLVLPRRTSPRVRVPKGSVAIAAAQTAVYPLQTPGGWHLIGTTESVMFDVSRNPPALVRPGDSVRFIPHGA